MAAPDRDKVAWHAGSHCAGCGEDYAKGMRLDDLLLQYFGTIELAEPTANGTETGVERLLVDLGRETDPSNRFALWSLLFLLDRAPALEQVFEDPDDRTAARAFAELVQARQQRMTASVH